MTVSLSLSVSVPAILGHYSDKIQTFQTQVAPAEIANLLGHDPRSRYWNRLPDHLKEMYDHLQRKTDNGRRNGTRRYIEERISAQAFVLGAFPAIAIGCIKPLQFVPYKTKFPQMGFREGVGEVEFHLSSNVTRVLLDGMARVAGALDLFDDGKPTDFLFPVTIFAPTAKHGDVELRELGQLFHDFNFLSEPIKSAHAIDLDQSNIYIQLAAAIGRAPAIVNYGGVQPRASSLSVKSKALVAQQVLLKFVRGAAEGADFQERLRDQAPKNQRLTPATFDEVRQKIEAFLGEIANSMGSAKWPDRNQVLLTAPGWSALGAVFHDLYVTLGSKLADHTKLKMAADIGKIDWSRWNQDFIGFLGEAAKVDGSGDDYKPGKKKSTIDTASLRDLVDANGRKKLGVMYGGRLGGSRFVQFIRDRIGLSDLLREAGQDLQVDEGPQSTNERAEADPAEINRAQGAA